MFIGLWCPGFDLPPLEAPTPSGRSNALREKALVGIYKVLKQPGTVWQGVVLSACKTGITTKPVVFRGVNSYVEVL